MKTVYFAHPMGYYNTDLESELLVAIRQAFPNNVVLNPNSKKHQLRSGGQMEYFLSLVRNNADVIVALPYEDGTFGAGVWAEIEAARHTTPIPIYVIAHDGEISRFDSKSKYKHLKIAETVRRNKALIKQRQQKAPVEPEGSTFGDYKRIKLAIQKGGLVVAPRRYGKTRALVEILHEDRKAALIVPNSEMKDFILSCYQDKYGQHEQVRAERRVYVDGSSQLRGGDLRNPPTLLRDQNIYVDEYFYGTYRGPFKAAVTSAPFRVEVIKPEIKEVLHAAKTFGNQMSSEEFLTQFMMY